MMFMFYTSRSCLKSKHTKKKKCCSITVWQITNISYPSTSSNQNTGCPNTWKLMPRCCNVWCYDRISECWPWVWQAGCDLSFNTIRNRHYGSSWCNFSWYTVDYERDSWEPQKGHIHNLLETPIYFHQQVGCQPAMLIKEWFHPLICHSILTQSKRLEPSYKQEVYMGNNGLLDRLHIALPGRDAKTCLIRA